jgi:hypothetical protein
MDIKSLKVPFEHTTAEIELILAGLRKLPMELVQELHDRMIHTANAEVQAQMTPPATSEAEQPQEAQNVSA